MSALLELADGGSAELLETDGRRVCLLSPHPSPTGSLMHLILAAEEAPLQIKVRSCQRVASGAAASARFRVEGRFVNLSRRQRELLLGASV